MPKKNKKNQEVQFAVAPVEFPYEVKAWAGMPQYCCRLCAFDTLDKDVIWDHLARVHIQEPKHPASLQAQAQPEEELAGAVVEKADGIYEVDLKEDQNGKTNIE